MKRSKKKRLSIFDVFSILWIILFIFVSIFVQINDEIKIVKASFGSWVYSYTDVLEVQVSSSNDDGYVYVNQELYYNTTPELIPVKSAYDDVRTWFRFTGFNAIPWNNTHRGQISSATISFHHSCHVQENEDCYASLYYANQYAGVDSVPYPTNFSDVMGLITSYSYVNINFRDAYAPVGEDQWFNATVTNLIFDSLWVMNDTYGYQDEMIYFIQSQSGDVYRYYDSYDYISSYAVKLRISYRVNIWVEKDEGYQETYRDYDIYLSSAYEWEPFMNLTEYDPNSHVTTFNDTHIITNIFDADDDIVMNRTFDYVSQGYIALQFRIYIDYYHDTHGATASPVFVLALIERDNVYPYDDAFEDWFGIVAFGPASGDYIRLRFISADDGDMYYRTIINWWNPNVEKFENWIRYFVNFTSREYDIEVYNDTFQTKWLDINGTVPSNQFISTGEMRYYRFFTTAQASMTYPDDSRVRLQVEEWREPETYYVIDPDTGEEIGCDDFTTIAQAKACIDNYLLLYVDSLAWMGDMMLFLIGITGLVMIPLSFILCIQSMQSGEYIAGLKLMLMMFFTGLGFVIVWLWS